MAETITKRITKIHGTGFMVEGYENYFNLSKSHEASIVIPPVGTEIEFTYNAWTNPTTKRVTYYVDEIIPVTQVAASVQRNPGVPPASYDGLQQAAATAPVASTPVASPAPVAQPPRNGPERPQPDPGSFAYRDTIGIPRTACLKDAGELLASVYAGGASELLSDEQLGNLASNITRLANLLYQRYYVHNSLMDIAKQAMPDKYPSHVAIADDTLVPTPSDIVDRGMDDPGPQEER